MMKNVLIITALSVMILLVVIGCRKADVPLTYEQITPAEARKLMNENPDCIILDVRTEEEFASGHIENAILIPDYEIEAKAESMIADKDRMILVYCRSGRRSKLASEALVNLGYTNVKEFGGIIDWEYETVTDDSL